MADITMCDGTGCPRKAQCYRYTARPSQRQSYFAKVPLNVDGSCDHFWTSEEVAPQKDLTAPGSEEPSLG